MKRTMATCAALLVPLLMLSAPVDAQQRTVTGERVLTLEARGSYGFPIGDFANEFVEAESDVGMGFGASLMMNANIGIYAGWTRDMFDCEICGAGDEIRVTGYEAGVQFEAPQMAGNIVPWVRGGLIAHRTRFLIEEVDFQTDRELGFQGSVGFDAPIFGDWFSVSPSVRYNSITPELEIVDIGPIELGGDMDIQYLSFDLGLRFHVPRNW